MTTRKPGEAVPSVGEAAGKSWYVFKYFNPGSATDPHISYVAGYRRAVADCLADLFEFGGWDQITRRMLEVFDDLAVQRDAVRQVADDDEIKV